MTSLYYKTQDKLMASMKCYYAAKFMWNPLFPYLQSAEYNEHESDCKVEELQKEVCKSGITVERGGGGGGGYCCC